MGCCKSSNKNISRDMIKEQIRECICNGNTRHLMYLITCIKQELKSEYNIDTITINLENNKEVTLGGFSLIKGNLVVFKYIHQVLKANLVKMEMILGKANLNGLSIICANNYVDIFDYYAPLYFQFTIQYEPKTKKILRETIDFSEKFDKILEIIEICHETSYTPIQQACYNGHIPILQCAMKLASKMTILPAELDINYIDSLTGENCALVACKAGNYSMIRFLHTICQADFFIHNIYSENCIQVLAAASQLKYICEFYHCLVYLVEKIGIDITYNYQETLLLLTYPKALDYFVGKLEKCNIFVNKEEFEKEAAARKSLRQCSSLLEDTETFHMSNLYPELGEYEQSSIIGSSLSRSTNPASLLGEY